MIAIRVIRHQIDQAAKRIAYCVSVTTADWDALPGGDLVRRGISDLAAGRRTVESLLVSIGAPRLRLLGIALPEPQPSPEHALYALLARDDSDAAHGRYNALIRKLVSFERALACADR